MNNQLSAALNGYLANLGVSYIKLHNLHWNVVGLNFKSIHEYLQSLYEGMAESMDNVAELLKMGGAVPVASLKEFLNLATVEELSSEERSAGEVLAVVLADFEVMKAKAEEIRSLADQEDAYEVVNAMEDDLGHYNKAIWFLKAMMK